MARIALDAMGGDFAPQATVAGALLALAELDPAHSIQLVGRTAVVEAQLRELLQGELASHQGYRDRLSIIEAPDVVEMTDKPSAVVRGKPNSSMAVGLRLQADGLSDAFVSAGSTGAQMASSMVILRLHAGLKRPAIATFFPSLKSNIVVLDSGANVDCSPEELVQFARLGATYAECVMGRPNPAVGLLSIGEEPEKGNAVTKETHVLLTTSGLNFIGNVEGRDLPNGATEHHDIDVVVCDGFVGNVLLKFYEGIGPMMIETLRKSGVDAEHLEAALKHLDYSEQGGVPLLGVKGVSIIAHGKSSSRAVKNALKAAARTVTSGMNDLIGERLATPQSVA
ncbi:MAG: phosphate acyltransferase PlsX [Gemmatimonadota bacterium]|nr:phosphate acyltransferase PlsX [Gemmatimonadota bacterium]